MKHRKTGRQFGRVRAQRKALRMSLLSSLIIHGRIETTEAKAKETKSLIDKVITKAKRSTDSRMEAIRKIENDLSQKAVQTLVEGLDKFSGRDSGYARVIKLAPRKSDGSPMAIVELVDMAKKPAVKKTEDKKTPEVEEVEAEKVESKE